MRGFTGSLFAAAYWDNNQLTPQQKAASGLIEGYFDNHGWGGGLGTSWRTDPANSLTMILLTQRAWSSAKPLQVCQDFWTCVYQSLDD